jgi:hypothetical protein
MHTFAALLLGLIWGTFFWPAFRLTPRLARWICQPFGTPREGAMALLLIFSVAFIAVIIVSSFLLIFYTFFEQGYSGNLPASELSSLRRYMLAASLLGPFLPGIMIKLEAMIRRSFSRNK